MNLEQLLAELDPTRWPADWRLDWEIREDAKPAPEAWHRSGLCFIFEYERIDDDGNLGWAMWDSSVSSSRLVELQTEMGQEAFSKFWKLLGRQARAMWHELGYHNKSWRKGPMKPESTMALLGIKMDSDSWRQHWEIRENDDDPVKLPTAWHRSGLCFVIEYDDIHWTIGAAEESESREQELLQGLGEAEFLELRTELARQLATLWRERGYTDFSPHPNDFSAHWRTEWVLSTDKDTKAHAVHSSGLSLTIVTDIDMGHVPVWWAVESKHFSDQHARLRGEMGDDAFDDFLSKRRREALELWYCLGSAGNLCPTNVFGSPLSNACPAGQPDRTD